MMIVPILLAAVTDVWAGIVSHPAVVSPVSYEYFGRPETVVSLSGEWDFTTRNHGSGSRAARYATDMWAKNSRKIVVPGVWEAQGVGEPGMGLPHLCADNSPKKIRNVFAGEGWYRRYVHIPASWKGSRVWLKAGGVSSMGCFYLNDNAVSWMERSVGAAKWEVTPFVKFGETNKVVAMTDNVVGCRGNAATSLNRWGGLWRDVELEATPRVYIDDAWVRGSFDARAALVRVEVGGVEGKSDLDDVLLRVTVEDASIEKPALGGLNEIALPLKCFRPWTPEKPVLYWAKIELVKRGEPTMTRYERFGVRKFEVRGKQFYLNDRPFFVRGFGDNAQYPITGCTPADRGVHRRHLETARKAGFNFVRHHTHSECPEYMEAADECGIMVQPELPYYLDAPNDHFGYDPIRDVDDLMTAFRRYVSFAVVSFGNEGLLGPAANKIVYKHVKKVVPDLLVLSQDGGTYIRDDHGEGESDFCSGPLTTWKRGSFNLRTFVCHEYMNLAVKLDWRNAGNYTGVWFAPIAEADRVEHLAHTGLPFSWLTRLQDAAHALQAYWQKHGIEHARADPYCDGYSYWTITDTVQFKDKAGIFGGQGIFDAFWQTKNCGLSPKEFSRFNSTSCVLLDTETETRVFEETTNRWLCCEFKPPYIEQTNRVFVSGEKIPAKILFAHFGEDDLVDAKLQWRLNAGGKTLLSGEKDIGKQVLGPAREIASLDIIAPEVVRPVKVEFVAQVIGADGFKCENSWPMWVFERNIPSAVPANVVIAGYGSQEAKRARAEGRNLLVVAEAAGALNYTMGWWNIGEQCGTAFVPHPMLGDFPYEKFLSPLVFRIIHQGVKLPVEGYEPSTYVAVSEGSKDAYLLLAAKQRADGSREVFLSGLDIESNFAESRSLRYNILNWLSQGKGK